MTTYGYLRVNPHAVAGTAAMQEWWMRFHGCDKVFADVWQGPGHPPMFDRLLHEVSPGDVVLVPVPSVFGPTAAHERQARKYLSHAGVAVEVLGEEPPVYEAEQQQSGRMVS